MFRLFNYYRFIPATFTFIVLSSCGHSNPEIHGGNTDPVRVKMMTANPLVSAMSDAYSGTVEAGSSTTLSFSTAGTINQINVTEGQRVAKGQLIGSVDGASAKNAYDIALATLREAQDAYNRMKKLHDANALPEMQWVSVQEKLKQAEAAAAIAKKGMGDTDLHSPISGVVAHKLTDVGQMAAPGIPVVEIMDISTLKVKISVTESDLANMKTGDEATITIGDRTYTGKLVEKGVAANSLSRNYDVKFRITNPDDNLLPGMICNVIVEGITPTQGADSSAEIVLPPQAVVLDFDNSSYVWISKNGVAQRKRVEIAGLDSRGIIIKSGLNPTDSVIVEGQQKLSSGLKVVSVN